MTETTLRSGGAPDSAPAPAGPPSERRRRVILLAALAALALGLLGTFVVLRGSGEEVPSGPVTAARRAAPAPAPGTTPVVPPGAPAPRAPATAPPANLVGRNPFAPLYVAAAPSTGGLGAAGTGTGTLTGTGTTAGTGTSGAGGTTGAGTGTTAATGATTGSGTPGTSGSDRVAAQPAEPIPGDSAYTG